MALFVNQSVNKSAFPKCSQPCASLYKATVSKIEELRQTMLTLSHSGDDLAKTLAGALTITRTPKDQFSDKVRARGWAGREQLSILLSFYHTHSVLLENHVKPIGKKSIRFPLVTVVEGARARSNNNVLVTSPIEHCSIIKFRD